MSDHPLDDDPAWQTMRRIVEAREHTISLQENMIAGRDETIAALRAERDALLSELNEESRRHLEQMAEICELAETRRAQYFALREAAGKVTCWECNDSGRMVNGLYVLPGEPEFIPCPYCGAIRNLRALLHPEVPK